MKKVKMIFFAVCLMLAFHAAAWGLTPEEDVWTPDAQDQRRGLPNVSAPPERREPIVQLAPRTDEGIVRRVALPEGGKAAALTFDLCELDTVTTGCDMEVLNFLRQRHIPATLFMGGKWMRTHARRVRQIMTEPLFEIGNHAWSHGNCALLSPEGLRAQVMWTQAQYELLREDVLRAARESGAPEPDIPPVPRLFRLPYGRSSGRALKALAGMGLRVIQWDVAAEAGDNSNPKRARRAGRRVASMVRPGSILLFHANRVPKGTALLLREVVDALQEAGYRFVTAGELLEMGQPQTVRDGYFTTPGDNRALDRKFGADGTGRRTPFTGR
ncbi:MAG: polysaccharide deacetylase family protein [Fretibacterium sp.]|nr:polysaccharide deacetylase family protein [Fretibacterium sp.]